MNIMNMPAKKSGGHQFPDTIIIHSMAQFVDTETDDFYAKDLLDHLGLSAHYLIDPSGVVIGCVDPQKIAWHAKGHNYKSIGIEVLVPGAYTYETFVERIKSGWISNDQYTSLVELVRGLKKMHEIEKVVRHSDIDPSRKVDPGEGFPWELFLRDIS